MALRIGVTTDLVQATWGCVAKTLDGTRSVSMMTARVITTLYG